MKTYELRKLKKFGEWTNWKKVSKEVAEHKLRVRCQGWRGDDAPYGGYEWFCPYEVRATED